MKSNGASPIGGSPIRVSPNVGGLAETRGVVKLSNAGGEKISRKNYNKFSDVVRFRKCLLLLLLLCLPVPQPMNIFFRPVTTRLQAADLPA